MNETISQIKEDLRRKDELMQEADSILSELLHKIRREVKHEKGNTKRDIKTMY